MVGSWRVWSRVGPLTIVGAAICVIVLLLGLGAAWIAPFDPVALGAGLPMQPPGWPYLLGTDELGRDIFSRVVYAARIALFVAVISTLLAAIVGIPLGLVSGYYQGWVDSVIMRLTDAWLAFPVMVLALGLTAALGPGLENATFAIGFVTIPLYVRLARGQVLGISQRPYIDAARAAGQRNSTILAKHILPNIVPILIVQSSLAAGSAILVETALSFLGVGVMPPTPSWGAMLSAAQPYLMMAPWMAVAPGMFIFLLVLGLNLVGDGLRDALDPRAVR